MRCLKYEQFHSFGIQEQVFMYNINLQKEERMISVANELNISSSMRNGDIQYQNCKNSLAILSVSSDSLKLLFLK